MKRIHLNGRDISDLFTIISFKEYLKRPGKNELMYCSEIVEEGMVYYFVNNY